MNCACPPKPRRRRKAESINNFEFLIELIITQSSEFFNLELLKNSLALAANSLTKRKSAGRNVHDKHFISRASVSARRAGANSLVVLNDELEQVPPQYLQEIRT